MVTAFLKYVVRTPTPKIFEDNEDMRQFAEMCFDPNSPMNDRLKQTILEMLKEAK